MNYRKRAFTALVASALALPFLASPALAGHGGPVAPGEQNIAEFCTNPFSENFVDVAATDVFALAIQCISTAGREIGQPITVGGPEGIPANQYGPNRSVLRGQMASFIARMLDAAEQRDRQQNGGTSQIQALPGYDNSNSFTDVPNNNVHVANINRLADAGVVLGGPGGRAATIYAPNEFISRAQMASFINRAAAYAMSQNPNNSGNGTGYTAANNANYFVDSGEIAVHQANINGLASAGIVIGVQPVNEHRYAPRANVTRAQMAGFISRTLSQLYDDNRVHSLLEDLTGNFAAGDREGSAAAGRTVASGSTRQFEITGLTANEEYRVTLVNCENVNRGANDLVTFTPDGTSGLANAGTVNSRITGFGFGGTGNAVSPSAQTATFTTGGTSVTVNVQNNGPECYVVVIYRNGGTGQALASGGAQERLNIDAQGRPTEFFGISGDITVTAAQQPVQGQADVAFPTGPAVVGDVRVATITPTNGQTITSVAVSGACVAERTVTSDEGTGAGFQVNVTFDTAATDCVITFVTTFGNGTTDTDTVTVGSVTAPQQNAAPLINEARVATDAAVSTDGVQTTNTASQGDVFTLRFNERVSTNIANATLTVADGGGDSFTIACGETVAASTNTAARCTLSSDGLTLTIELLEDPVVTRGTATGNNGVADFPLTITATNGFVDANGAAINLPGSPDRVIDRDANTRAAGDPTPFVTQGQATISPDSQMATAGNVATFTANANTPIASVRVEGPCVDTVTRTTDASPDAGFQVAVTIRENTAPGTCTLTFVTSFQNGSPNDTDTARVVVTNAAPTITDARVATDAVVASDGTLATDTASDGDIFQVRFSERVQISGQRVTVTVRDEDGDVFIAECLLTQGATAAAGNTPAACVLAQDGRSASVELLQDPIITRNGGDGVADFPLRITAVSGLSDSAGQPINLATGDTLLESDTAAEAGDPSPVGGTVLNQQTGETFDTLTAALADAQPGQTLRAFGTFTETVQLTKDNLTLVGENAVLNGRFEVRGVRGGSLSGFEITAFPFVGGEPTDGLRLIGNVQNFTISGNVFDGTGADAGFGGANGIVNDGGGALQVTIVDNTFQDLRRGIALNPTTSVTAARDIVIDGNTFLRNGTGIAADNGDTAIINNSFDLIAREGAPTGYAVALLQSGITVRGNTFGGQNEVNIGDFTQSYDLEGLVLLNTFAENQVIDRAANPDTVRDAS